MTLLTNRQAEMAILRRILSLTMALALAVGGAITLSALPASAADHLTTFASLGCFRPPPVGPGETVEQTLRSGGQQRTYLVHVPAGYEDASPTPLILAFHGAGGTSAQIELFSNLDTLNAIVLYPQGTTGTNGKASWEGAPYSSGVNDVRFVKDLLNRTQAQFCVNPRRIYATGKSNGGGFTALLACQLPGRIAAFASVAGAYYPGTTLGCGHSPPVPILEFHGTDDSVIHYQGGTSHGENYPAVPTWLNTWIEKDRCMSSSRHDIGSDVVEFDWSHCAFGTEVTHYQILGGGHTWPGATTPSGEGTTTQTISATAILWDFFMHHPLYGSTR